MTSTMTIWHNPRCSKSRQTLALLEEHGISLNVRRYLDDTPTVEEIRDVLGKLGIKADGLVRKKESLFKELDLSDAGDDALINAMAAHPKLIERPVVMTDTDAAIGRPPEDVLRLLK
ncbi:arsenate reductase (glutaredoxin) [Bradymonadaceae bacterium TMQ3]|uniref:Arsenate reductase (Glutaredoxin) n=1 Tax=Lujinxingia sediminis TaxID=2480984 RepID=A0ABY0CZF2_9DELT|nr:arsenate reductase (glutaredoxin) [Lujinxingia sediminis]RDV39130.1 arsenate reductase (glutaredoxin) [Bradymonadaceae bacterium TMQ3]RVU48825.1 arsenate reductase (glutaredoxin) [Lujinxingia sediminis]TXC78118.1 arsenate reductase (glutaredoxin) [Bradymonadales bacterium TMQ1]